MHALRSGVYVDVEDGKEAHGEQQGEAVARVLFLFHGYVARFCKESLLICFAILDSVELLGVATALIFFNLLKELTWFF